MVSDSLPEDIRKDQAIKEEAEIRKILNDYWELLDIQKKERENLVLKVDEISSRVNDEAELTNKMDHLVTLLLDIKQQISSLYTPSRGPPVAPDTPKSKIMATDKQIDELSREVERRAELLDSEIATIQNTLKEREDEIMQKDLYIEELNNEIQVLANEKQQLLSKLEELNSVTSSKAGQLDLLQKLAESDPRYKAIDTLKRHGSLSEIQLAFSMGTSITQVRKYMDDLIKLGLVKKNKGGRFVWIGKLD